MFDAAEALRGGLVESVHAPDDLLAQARTIAREIADNTSAVSIALTRQMLWRATGDETPSTVLAFDAPMSRELGTMADCREGVASFIEKRAPKFPGRVSTDMPSQYPWWK